MTAAKVLLVSGSLPPHRCGVGDYTDALARALQREGIWVSVLSSCGVSTDAPYPIKAIVAGWRLNNVRDIMAAIRHEQPDIVHFQFPTQAYARRRNVAPWMLPSLTKMSGAKVVQTWHENVDGRAVLSVLGCDAVIAVRPNYLKTVKNWIRPMLRASNFQFIPNASNIPTVTLSESERLAIQRQFTNSSKRLISYFGLLYEHKGIEYLFEVCDPRRHHLLMITRFCDSKSLRQPALAGEVEFHRRIRTIIDTAPWRGSATVTGHLPSREVAELVGASDAILLPFKNGAGIQNTSLKAAIVQGTFVLTTSQEFHGYQAQLNTYFAKPGSIGEMREALAQYVGRRTATPATYLSDWTDIARRHAALYESLV